MMMIMTRYYCYTTSLLILITAAVLSSVDGSSSNNDNPEQPVSFPVLYCKNEQADADECPEHAQMVKNAVEPWFTMFMGINNDDRRKNRRGRRQLLDCSRFCDDGDKTDAYWTLHLPCDCQNTQHRRHHRNRRTLWEAKSNQNVRKLVQTGKFEGPIQIFQRQVETMQKGHCRDVLSEAKCIVSFVESYEYYTTTDGAEEEDDDDFTMNPKHAIPGLTVMEDEVYDPLTDKILDDIVFDPNTGKGVHVDPETGEALSDGEVTYNPVTGEIIMNDEAMYDPVTGNVIPKPDPNITNSGSNNNSTNIIDEEVFNPVSGNVTKYDPVTGLPIEDNNGNNTVYDPVTGEVTNPDEGGGGGNRTRHHHRRLKVHEEDDGGEQWGLGMDGVDDTSYVDEPKEVEKEEEQGRA